MLASQGTQLFKLEAVNFGAVKVRGTGTKQLLSCLTLWMAGQLVAYLVSPA